jgi:hypothetical protein
VKVVLRNPRREVEMVGPRTRCGAPTPGEVCGFCRLRERATAPVEITR